MKYDIIKFRFATNIPDPMRLCSSMFAKFYTYFRILVTMRLRRFEFDANLKKIKFCRGFI